MTLTGAIIIFVIIWWLCFFVVLPIGVRGQYENDTMIEGTEEGAPVNPMLKKKAFFAVLPIGVRGQYEDETTVEGTEEGAPVNPMLKKKALWASIGALAITSLVGVSTLFFDYLEIFFRV
jgi:predicted secreted protein